MADEYTPTTDEVRAEWSFIYEDQSTDTDRQASFDRWLAQHDREVAARALREAARSYEDDESLAHVWAHLDAEADRIENPS